VDSAIVVGAGTFGASLAWMLAREGVAVTLIDQFEPGDPRSSSGGETRLYRCSHGGDQEYAASARRARELWLELEVATGESLLSETGVVWFAHREDGWEAQSERALRELEIPVERLTPDDTARLYPSFAGDDLLFSVLEPEAGAIRASRAVKALVRAAESEGARVKRGRARPVGHAVELEDGARIEAGAVIWSCGGWLSDLFPGLVTLRTTRQELFFFDGGDAWAGVPCWVDYDLAAYGTGDVDSLGVKAAPDVEGPLLGADDELPASGSSDGERSAREYVSRRFPALGEAPLKASTCCRYELSPDSNFIAAQHPAEDRVWIVGGGSGHGFKHGPAMAERLVAALRGVGTLPERWGLGERQPGRSFRTAGSNASD
jgi:sarcosine oxidase